MILKCGRVIYLGLSPYVVKPMFWFSLLANEIAGNFISSSGCGPDFYEGRAPDDMAHNLSCMLHIVIVQQVSSFFSLSFFLHGKNKPNGISSTSNTDDTLRQMRMLGKLSKQMCWHLF